MTRTPVDNRLGACFTTPDSGETRPTVSPVSPCFKTHRNTPLTCANVPAARVFHPLHVSPAHFSTTPNHVSAGQSVIHNHTYSPVTPCFTRGETRLTCGNALVSLDPKREFPCAATVSPPAPTGRVRIRAYTRTRPREDGTPTRRNNTTQTAPQGATR